MKMRLTQPDQSTRFNHKSLLILHLWCEEQPGGREWRASVEIPETGRRVGFASLEQLFAFLIDFSECMCDMGQLEDK